MKARNQNIWSVIILVLATAAIFLEFGVKASPAVRAAIHVLDFAVLGLFWAEISINFAGAKYKWTFLKRNWFDSAFIVVFTALFLLSKSIAFLMALDKLEQVAVELVFLRNIFVALKIFSRFRKLNTFFKQFATNPAQTIAFSFLILILVGTMLLMMPFATADGSQLGFINSLFTATSAVCVTGLIVVDTATYFSTYGQAVIMLLIQCGGLGIMIFTFFASFLLGRRVSREERVALSYMLDESDMHNVARMIVRIVLVTLGIELAGMALMFVEFGDRMGVGFRSVFFSLFHAVSAFCNAGFALFTDSLEAFRGSLLMNFTVACLIILGGISFAVIMNVFQFGKNRLMIHALRRRMKRSRLTLNSKVVLTVTAILLVSGAFIIYGLEHRGNLIGYDLKTQYMAAAFQSVTLRTAGFNSVNMSNLRIPTYLIMILFMFIGGAAGSTAGGIKVNNLAVIYAYIKSIFRNRFSVILHGYFLPKHLISKALLIILMGAAVVFTGTMLLTLTEDQEFMKILFEAVSAFGTVGLSTGITPSLTAPGKLVIIAMMFLGRLGPLTIMAALSIGKTTHVKYPEGHIAIG